MGNVFEGWKARECRKRKPASITSHNAAILIETLYSYSMEQDIVGKDYSSYPDIPSVSVNPLTVKWLLGHSTKTAITAHYTHKTFDALKGAIKLLA